MPAETMTTIAGPNVRIFNVKYSPNLGDGLLSECLEQALIAGGADPGTHSLDLAARTQYSDGSENRSAKLRVLEALPALVRPVAVRLPLAVASMRTWQPHYRKGLQGADCAVIGGGNLLADLDLNFPTKLSLAIHEAAWRCVPAFIYGCGVSSGWSRKGLSLMHNALATGAVRGVFVRDERSRKLWDTMFGTRHNLAAQVVRDPGLLACETYPETAPSAGLIGLNITSQLAVKYHSADAPSPAQLEDFYVDFAQATLEQGKSLAIFTNGSPEDRAALSALKPRFAALDGATCIAYPDATTPAQLVAIVGALEGLVAFRMHAIIAAYSCNVPFVALSWDPKLDSFAESVGRSDWLARVTQHSGAQAATMLAGSLGGRLGDNDGQRTQVIAQARQDVGKLYAAIVQALGSQT